MYLVNCHRNCALVILLAFIPCGSGQMPVSVIKNSAPIEAFGRAMLNNRISYRQYIDAREGKQPNSVILARYKAISEASVGTCHPKDNSGLDPQKPISIFECNPDQSITMSEILNELGIGFVSSAADRKRSEDYINQQFVYDVGFLDSAFRLGNMEIIAVARIKTNRSPEENSSNQFGRSIIDHGQARKYDITIVRITFYVSY